MKYEKPEIIDLAPAILAIQAQKGDGPPDNQCPGSPDDDLPSICAYQSDE